MKMGRVARREEDMCGNFEVALRDEISNEEI
jgi:hypothetical protein